MRHGITAIILTAALAPICAGAELRAEKQLDIGLQKQLCVDDYVISQSRGLSRTVGTVSKANDAKPLPFVAAGGGKVDVWPLFVSPFYDAEKKRFCMWHRVSFDDASRRQGAGASDTEIGVGSSYQRGLSESTDGIHFTLVAPLEGLTTSGDTNLVVTDDAHESDPAHRYKIGYDSDSPIHAAAFAHSADGIHWTPYNQGQPVTYRANDFTNQIIWDPAAKAYRLFTRTDFGWGGGPLADRVDVSIGDKHLEVRGVRSMINPDFKSNPTDWRLEHHWVLDGEEECSSNRPPIEDRLKDSAYLQRVRDQALRRQIYTTTAWIYQDVYFGLMAVLEYPTDVSEGSKTDHETRHERSIENYYFSTSRNGVDWNFHWIYAGQPLVPRGPAGAWDKDMIFPSTNIITHDDKHWIYYGGNNERHGAAEKDVWFTRQGGIGLAHLRLDGFVALEAGQEPGVLTTKPFTLEGPRLQLNVDAHGAGSVRVEVLDAAGSPIPEFSGDGAETSRGVDELRLVPKWKNRANLADLVGMPVRLRVHLANARLYSFQIQP